MPNRVNSVSISTNPHNDIAVPEFMKDTNESFHNLFKGTWTDPQLSLAQKINSLDTLSTLFPNQIRKKYRQWRYEVDNEKINIPDFAYLEEESIQKAVEYFYKNEATLDRFAKAVNSFKDSFKHRKKLDEWMKKEFISPIDSPFTFSERAKSAMICYETEDKRFDLAISVENSKAGAIFTALLTENNYLGENGNSINFKGARLQAKGNIVEVNRTKPPDSVNVLSNGSSLAEMEKYFKYRDPQYQREKITVTKGEVYLEFLRDKLFELYIILRETAIPKNCIKVGKIESIPSELTDRFNDEQPIRIKDHYIVDYQFAYLPELKVKNVPKYLNIFCVIYTIFSLLVIIFVR